MQHWSFITASNPFSTLLSENENMGRYQILKEAVQDYTCFEGEGIGEDKNWKPEQSLLILGIEATEAIRIGELFEQNAIVMGSMESLLH